MFQVTRVYSDSNGDSHFEVLDIPLEEAGSVGRLSKELPAKGVVFREVEPTYIGIFILLLKNNISKLLLALKKFLKQEKYYCWRILQERGIRQEIFNL